MAKKARVEPNDRVRVAARGGVQVTNARGFGHIATRRRGAAVRGGRVGLGGRGTFVCGNVIYRCDTLSHTGCGMRPCDLCFCPRPAHATD